jgi:predicted RecA/RadA family phage recombinase
MKNFVQPGNSVTVALAPASGVKSGDGVLVGALFGVAAVDAPAAGGDIEIAVVGVFDLVKANGGGTGILAGGVVSFDPAAKKCTGVLTAPNVPVGLALAAAGDSATVVRVRLFPGVGGVVVAAGVTDAVTALATTVDGHTTTIGAHTTELADHESRIAALEAAP